ncbi:hypothetical protein A2U01_0109766 [Trifolium medium]|uniref:Uncharacterized protein n=1 Tax=Trifolium medium TaxID=97028 RepID=A0A392VM64_9FABA|nr:hypothetical protein [Trifolium medium]
MARAKFEAEPRKSGLGRQATCYLSRRDVFCCSRQFSPETLKLSVLVSPGARQAKSSEGN